VEFKGVVSSLSSIFLATLYFSAAIFYVILVIDIVEQLYTGMLHHTVRKSELKLTLDDEGV
jgi:hypothetical protein